MKRDTSFTVKVSEQELLEIRKAATEMDMDVSEMVRACIAIALPSLQKVSLLRRIRLDDNENFSRSK